MKGDALRGAFASGRLRGSLVAGHSGLSLPSLADRDAGAVVRPAGQLFGSGIVSLLSSPAACHCPNDAGGHFLTRFPGAKCGRRQASEHPTPGRALCTYCD